MIKTALFSIAIAHKAQYDYELEQNDFT